jgi:23S rRNA pseudouridine1911/1915/1917 synthase
VEEAGARRAVSGQAMADTAFTVPPELAGQTLAGAVKKFQAGLSWSEVRKLIATRRVTLNGRLCVEDLRRVRAGESVLILDRPHAPPPDAGDVRIVHADADLVVVEKPPGILSHRRIEELNWPEERKRRQPTLDEVVQRMLPQRMLPQRMLPSRPDRMRTVHRLDRDTSGLMLFALSPAAEQALVRMFKKHEVRRKYLAVVHGRLEKAQVIETWLVRDRGDGIRGSTPRGKADPEAKRAVTRIRPVEHIGDRVTVVECELETGRTHQIRIHLSEIGHPLCCEQVYMRPSGDDGGAPRVALHSTELSCAHPVTGKPMRFRSPLPEDLHTWLHRLRAGASGKTR